MCNYKIIYFPILIYRYCSGERKCLEAVKAKQFKIFKQSLLAKRLFMQSFDLPRGTLVYFFLPATIYFVTLISWLGEVYIHIHLVHTLGTYKYAQLYSMRTYTNIYRSYPWYGKIMIEERHWAICDQFTHL